MNTVIVDCGGANLASLQFALQRLGCETTVTADPAQIKAASHVLLPGVGAAGIAMQRLRDQGLDRLIPELRQPVLGICLGMQLLADASGEDDTQCLGIVPGSCDRLMPESGLPVPHMGWNQVKHYENGLFAGIENETHFYFVHSYVFGSDTYSSASTSYGKPFVAAVQRDNFYGTQFHPERSGTAGSRLLQNFLELPSCC
ncbi:MAG: imidazole glycerol phosphate synthase subunit HisH [Gammaproteobacteria bacterium]|nr:imidazole glycerol phosphate synthase subunit HisH [Gammaproteobacteria bacterium]